MEELKTVLVKLFIIFVYMPLDIIFGLAKMQK